MFGQRRRLCGVQGRQTVVPVGIRQITQTSQERFEGEWI